MYFGFKFKMLMPLWLCLCESL